jgi:regulator of sigma E protease
VNPIPFIVAIAVLVAIHELGHYGVARACGVKVLRFAIGFGPRVAGWTSKKTGIEYVVGLLPLGGYVKMLDEREGPVLPQERARAFNTQTLKVRAAIVLAGPMANLLLAIVLYSCVNWTGVEQAQAVLARPVQGSVAQAAGLVGGERILRVGFADADLNDVVSFEDVRWWLIRGALAHRNVQMEYVGLPAGSDVKPVQIAVFDMEKIDARNADAQMFRSIGVIAPFSAARIGELKADGAAVQAGLRMGDAVLQIDQTDVVDSGHLLELIRSTGNSGQAKMQSWLVDRAGVQVRINVTPNLEKEGEVFVGRIGAMIAAAPAKVVVRYGPWDGFTQALTRTWEVSILTLKMMGKIVMGDASLKNLSGPLTIADYAGKSAAMGATSFVVFLALISISLGVLNLLPIPVLDGGHLMYYVWELLTGKPVSERWAERLQRLGLGVLMAMMSVALFNDFSLFFGHWFVAMLNFFSAL